MKSFLFLLFLPGLILADWIISTPVGPNAVHHHEYREQGPWNLNVLEIDLTHQYNILETVKANDLVYGNETTSSMAGRNNSEGHRIVGAINGDFYATGGIPIGAQVRKGVLLKRPYNSRSVFGYTVDKEPVIRRVQLGGAVIARNLSSYSVSGINESRQTDYLVVYNKYFGAATGTNEWGTEITTRYVSDAGNVNDTVRVVVTAKDSIMASGHGNNAIPGNGVVFSGHGLASTFLKNNIFIGDTVSFVLNLPALTDPIRELIGGTPRIIRNGSQSVEWQEEGLAQSFATDRHPRTGVGFNQDSTKVYFFTVDGRQPGFSVGMSLFEFADYMLEWNVHEGVNLDGGGSTTMYVRGRIVNSPSDAGGERAVSNALMAVCTAPTGPLAHFRITPDEPYVIIDEQLQFNVAGYDQFYNWLQVNPDSVSWSCDPAIGQISAGGLLTAAVNQGQGFVFVQQGSVKDSTLVHITDVAQIELTPDPVILQIGEQQQMSVVSKDGFGNIVSLEPQDYEWQVIGPFGTVDSTGLFTADQVGNGFIIVSYKNVADSAEYNIGTSVVVTVDDFTSTSNWSLSGTLVNLGSCSFTPDGSRHVSAPSSGKLDYSLATGGTSALYLNCSIPVSGTPDAIGLYVYGDGKGHWLRGEFQDADGEKFLMNFTEAAPGINWNDSWQYIEVPFSESIIHWSNPTAVLTFPVTWTRIYMAETDDGNKNDGTLYLDDFQVRFISTDINDPFKTGPLQFALSQNYPNPFNPVTTIQFSLPKTADVKLAIYDAAGRLVDYLVNGSMESGNHRVQWNSANYASGVYFYRIYSEQFAASKKMLVLK